MPNTDVQSLLEGAYSEPLETGKKKKKKEEIEDVSQLLTGAFEPKAELKTADIAAPQKIAAAAQEFDPEAALQAFGESATFQTLPTIQAGIQKGVVSALGALGFGPEAINKALKEQGFRVQSEPTIGQEIEQFEQRSERLREEAPGSALVGDIAGVFAPGVGGPSLLAKGVTKGVSKLAPTAAKAVSPLLTKAPAVVQKAAPAVGKVGAAALEGGLQAEALTQAEQLLGPEMPGVELGEAFETGATISGGIAASVPALRSVFRGISKVGRKGMSAMLGVPDEQINKYLADPDVINAAPDKESLLAEMRKIVQSASDDVAGKKANVAAAKEALKFSEKEIRRVAQEKGIKISQEIKQVKGQFDDVIKSSKEVLKRAATPADLADEAVNAMDDLKSKVIGGSRLSREILEESGATLPKRQILKNLKNVQKNLLKGADEAITDVAIQEQAALKRILDRVAGMPNKIPASKAKGIIQQLDDQLNILRDAGEFTSAKDGAIAQIRKAFDEAIKNKVPKYRKVMKDVALDAKTLSNAAKHFGTRDKALSKIKRATDVGGRDIKSALEELGVRTDRDFRSALRRATRAKEALASPTVLKQVERETPEFRKLGQLEKERQRLASPIQKQKIFELGTRKARRGLEAAEEVTQKAVSREKVIKTVEKVVESSGKTRDRAIRDLIELGDDEFISAVKEFSDPKGAFAELLKQTRKVGTKRALGAIDVAESFVKDATRGSKNVNLFALMGLGSVAGGALEGVEGAGIGAMVGAMADRFGPRLTKRILDFTLSLKKMPGRMTPDKIQKFVDESDLPRRARRYLKQQAVLQTQAAKTREKRKLGESPKNRFGRLGE